MKKPKSDYSIQTVINAFRLLEALRDSEELGVTELSRNLSLHKNNVFRLLATLEEKGYIARTKEGGSFVYRTRIRKESTLKRMMGDLVDRAFEGSTATAALHLLDKGNLSREELEQLRSLIDRKSKEELS